MKIFYLSQVNLERHYSGSVHTKEVVQEFAKRKNEIWLFAQSSCDLESQNGNIRLEAIGSIGGGTISYIWYQIKLFLRAFFLARKVRPHMIYARSETAMFVHILIKKIAGIPFFLELNNWPFRDFCNVRNVSSFLHRVISRVIDSSITNSKGIICVTEEIARRIRKRYKRSNGVFIVENGVNTGLFRPESGEWTRRKLRLHQNDYVIGFVAYFQYYNDAEMAVRAVAKLTQAVPGVKLVFVGGWAQTEHKKRIKELAAEIANNAVIITDEIPYNDMPKYISCFDLCLALFNTDVGDGSVMKIYEYLSCSKPVIGSRIDSLKFLKEEQLGYTVSIGDVETLVEKIRALESNKEKAEEMGTRGRQYVLKYRSWKIAANKILHCIKSSLNDTDIEFE